MDQEADPAAGLAEGQDQVLADDVAVDELGVDAGQPLGGGEVDVVDPVLGGDAPGDLVLVGDALLDQDLADLLAGRGRGLARGVYLVRGGDAGLDQELTEFLACLQDQVLLRGRPGAAAKPFLRGRIPVGGRPKVPAWDVVWKSSKRSSANNRVALEAPRDPNDLITDRQRESHERRPPNPDHRRPDS